MITESSSSSMIVRFVHGHQEGLGLKREKADMGDHHLHRAYGCGRDISRWSYIKRPECGLWVLDYAKLALVERNQ